MDFIMGRALFTTKNTIWVKVEWLTKSAHFLLIQDTWNVEGLAQLCVKEIVRLNGIPIDIVSDRDQRFQACFYWALEKAFGTKLNFSSSYHPETNGQTERVNQILKNMLRAYVLEFQGKCEDVMPSMEFS